jgi:hypothetical protein
MADDAIQQSRDWLAGTHSNALAWWLPLGAIVMALIAPAAFRATIWIAALSWMGVACILNARRCGRTHCRYTGPYFLGMVAPVLALAFASDAILAWAILGALTLAGCGLIWWATERAWGRFS